MTVRDAFAAACARWEGSGETETLEVWLPERLVGLLQYEVERDAVTSVEQLLGKAVRLEVFFAGETRYRMERRALVVLAELRRGTLGADEEPAEPEVDEDPHHKTEHPGSTFVLTLPSLLVKEIREDVAQRFISLRAWLIIAAMHHALSQPVKRSMGVGPS